MEASARSWIIVRGSAMLFADVRQVDLGPWLQAGDRLSMVHQNGLNAWVWS
jgi:hypothetical protein